MQHHAGKFARETREYRLGKEMVRGAARCGTVRFAAIRQEE
jgi:hypothetical protein